MASKKSTIARQKEANKKKYAEICAGLKVFYIVSLVLLAIGLILYFVPWACNYNKDYNDGAYEQSPLGWTYIIATLSNTFSTLRGSESDTVLFYFNLSYPFFSHAPGYTIALGVVTVLSLAALICSAVFYSLALFAKKHKFVYGALAAQIVLFVLLLAAMIIALLYNASGIYVDSASPLGYSYCDPDQCTMHTMIYFPLIVSLGGMIVGIVTAVRYSRAKALLNRI